MVCEHPCCKDIDNPPEGSVGYILNQDERGYGYAPPT